LLVFVESLGDEGQYSRLPGTTQASMFAESLRKQSRAAAISSLERPVSPTPGLILDQLIT
jgi:hypothetical protein